MTKITFAKDDDPFLEVWDNTNVSQSLESLSLLGDISEIKIESSDSPKKWTKLVSLNGKMYSVESSKTDHHNFNVPDFRKFNIGALLEFSKAIENLLGIQHLNSKSEYYREMVEELIKTLNGGFTHKRIDLLVDTNWVNKHGYPCTLYKWYVTNLSVSHNRAGRIIYTVLPEFELILFCTAYAKNQKEDLTEGEQKSLFKSIKEYLIKCNYIRTRMN
jgi:hypothetical protein